MKIVLSPLFIVIGLIMVILSIPFVLLGMLLLLGGFDDGFEWLMDHAPLMLWFDFVEGL